ncbi:hypothetical protein [uncultured Pseudokineococcus sp.]|uniref:hypothetical protein n=1 Tax=uncultured Pseudokineococcus sp. TaxID=1642928 RepID=UPI00261E14B5|nr:hypothetical protein [uncultured Pseudokineococcus sp.]
MQEPSAPTSGDDAAGHGPDGGDDSTVFVPPTPSAEGDAAEPSTVLAEILPGIAVVFGDVPAGLDLVDFGLVPTDDRARISTALASTGIAATAGGNVGTAIANAQGLYRLDDATRAAIDAGAKLATKDGAKLGTLITRGGLKQARFVPAAVASPAMAAAAIGPALAMAALQMKLSEISSLVSTNIALATQVLTTIRREQWAELLGLVASIDGVVAQAREVGAVPESLWDSIAGSEAPLRKQLGLYRENVVEHVRQLDRRDAQDRRQYLETNAEAIVFDANALLSSLKGWTGYQALRAGRARTAGADDPAEARLVDVITRDAQQELASGLATTTTLVDSLTRALQIIAELPGRAGMPLTQKRKDAKAVRLTCGQLLDAVRPLADALRPQAPAPQEPDVICAPADLDHEPYLRVLRWLLEDGENVRCLAFPFRLDELAKGAALLGRLDPEKWAAVVAVTDRRIITARPGDLREHGKVASSVPLDLLRYVRAATGEGAGGRARIDVITRDENVRWTFHPETVDEQVGALAALLAESMRIPDAERAELRQRGEPILGATARALIGKTPAELTGAAT